MSVPLTQRGVVSSYLDKLFPRLLKVPGVSYRFSCIKTQKWTNMSVHLDEEVRQTELGVHPPVLICRYQCNFPLNIVYPQIPDVCSHNSHPSPVFFFTFPLKKYWKCKDMILTGYAHIHSTHPLVPICHKSLCLGCYWLPFATS